MDTAADLGENAVDDTSQNCIHTRPNLSFPVDGSVSNSQAKASFPMYKKTFKSSRMDTVAGLFIITCMFTM